MSSTTTDCVTYDRPQDLETVHELLADLDSAKLVAGGQSLMLMLRQGLVDAEHLVDISSVPSLTGIETTDGHICINAATTYGELSNLGFTDLYRSLGDAVSVIADEQVRNMGTIGGALSHADPSLDIIPPLLCLDATVTLSSVDGRRTLPLSEFIVDFMHTDIEDHEVLESVTFERRDHDTSGGFYEKHAKVEGGWPIVGVAAVVELSPEGETFEAGRVALSAADYTAVRAPSVERKLIGEPVSANTIESAAAAVTDDINPIGDSSGSVAYKEHLAEVLTQRALAETVSRAGGEPE